MATVMLGLVGAVVAVYLVHQSRHPLPGLRDLAAVVRAVADIARALCRR